MRKMSHLEFGNLTHGISCNFYYEGYTNIIYPNTIVIYGRNGKIFAELKVDTIPYKLINYDKDGKILTKENISDYGYNMASFDRMSSRYWNEYHKQMKEEKRVTYMLHLEDVFNKTVIYIKQWSLITDDNMKTYNKTIELFDPITKNWIVKIAYDFKYRSTWRRSIDGKEKGASFGDYRGYSFPSTYDLDKELEFFKQTLEQYNKVESSELHININTLTKHKSFIEKISKWWKR